MSNKVNFNEIEMGGGNNGGNERKTVSPGVDLFTIEEAEVKQNTNNKEYIALKFVNKDGKYFKEQFYTTTVNALKRVKELATNSGIQLGEEDMEGVAAKLMGAKVGLIVGGEKERVDINGDQVLVTRARIKNAYNFSFKPADFESKKDSKIIIEDKTLVTAAPDNLAGATTTNPTDDLPF